MKKLFILIPLVMLLALPVFAVDVQVGALVEGVSAPIGSLDARVDFGWVTADAAFGFCTFSFNNPKLYIDGEEMSMPWDNLHLGAHGILLQAGVYGNWWRPSHMVVYSGLRGGVGLLGGSYNLETSGEDYIWNGSYYDYYSYSYQMDVGVSGQVWNLKFLILGWDFQLPSVPNAVFSVGVGTQGMFFTNLKADVSMSENHEYYGDYSESVEIKIDPGISAWGSFVEVGARVSLGRKE